MQQLSMIMVSNLILGYNSATSSQQRRKSPSPSFLREWGEQTLRTLAKTRRAMLQATSPDFPEKRQSTNAKTAPSLSLLGAACRLNETEQVYRSERKTLKWKTARPVIRTQAQETHRR